VTLIEELCHWCRWLCRVYKVKCEGRSTSKYVCGPDLGAIHLLSSHLVVYDFGNLRGKYTQHPRFHRHHRHHHHHHPYFAIKSRPKIYDTVQFRQVQPKMLIASDILSLETRFLPRDNLETVVSVLDL